MFPPVMASIPQEKHRLSRRDIPPEVLAVSPVSASPRYGAKGLSLPLNIIATIIAYVDDVADIARVTRTCRLMYYMTLPQLYERVTLRSYAELRYIDGRPEGFGSGSPITMALSGLATSNSAPLVREFSVTGSWAEPQMEDYKKGKVPDSTMLLSIALRAALDRMTNIRALSWELNTKPLKTVYQGLATRGSLVSLVLTFPSDRSPRPIVMVPPMPHLRNLRVNNIDPLCYPDDLSMLFLHSKKLEELKMHWSPRMREEAEPSTNLRLYFGKCLEAKYCIPLKRLSFQNFYGANTGDLEHCFDPTTLHSTEMINCFGGATSTSSAATIFVDETWKDIPEGKYFQNFKRTRTSEISEGHTRILSSFSGLEELYLVGEKSPNVSGHGIKSPVTDTPRSTPSSFSSPGSRTLEQANSALCKQYLQVLFTHHGHSLKKLLLHDSWALSGDQISDVVSSCPNLEELGLGLSDNEPSAMRILAPFLKNARVIRILSNSWLEKSMITDSELQEHISTDLPEPLLWKLPPTTKLEWSGVGDRVFRIGKPVQVLDEDGRLEWKREVWRATLDDVKHIDIWKMDSLEI